MWESIPLRLANTEWFAAPTPIAAARPAIVPTTRPISSSPPAAGLPQRVLSLWRRFKFRGLEKASYHPWRLIARAQRKSEVLAKGLARRLRPAMEPVLRRSDLGRKILRRIPEIPTPMAQAQAQALLAQRVQEVETGIGHLRHELAELRHLIAAIQGNRSEESQLDQRLSPVLLRLNEVEKGYALMQAHIREASAEPPVRRTPIMTVPEQSSPMPIKARSEVSPYSGNQDLSVEVGGGGFNFHDWEEHTRGSEQTIRDKQALYLPHFADCSQVILDAGCGRGEFLELLRNAGRDAYGIDLDDAMVAHCQSKGLFAEKADLLAHLAQLPDGHLGGLFAGQVVEHLPVEALAAFSRLAFQKLAPGGVILLETINPECLTVFSGAFYADPTHTKPVHPKALEFFLQQAGFGPVQIIPMSPFRDEDQLKLLREIAPLEPAVKSVVIDANRNFARLNELLYKPADYAAVARKPASL
jgi:SAM-dependent methyltransferase